MQNVKSRLDAWRDAEHRRDGLALGSSDWLEADEAAVRAAKVFHAEEAQEYARYAEDAFEDRSPWSALLPLGVARVGESGLDGLLAGWPRRVR